MKEIKEIRLDGLDPGKYAHAEPFCMSCWGLVNDVEPSFHSADWGFELIDTINDELRTLRLANMSLDYGRN